jgi:hypothetical protein
MSGSAPLLDPQLLIAVEESANRVRVAGELAPVTSYPGLRV